MSTYSHLSHELEADFKLELKVWRLDVAASSEFLAPASHDLAEAEVIIMTVRKNAVWPPEFLRGKTGAVEDRDKGVHAIVVLIEDDRGVLSDTENWNTVLHSSTMQIYPEVFAYEVISAQGGSFATPSLGSHTAESCNAFLCSLTGRDPYPSGSGSQ
jgi:hypothetical protein